MAHADVLRQLHRERRAVHQAYLALCKAIARAAVREPGALPDLMASFQARYDERTSLDLLIASYEPQVSLFDDAP